MVKTKTVAFFAAGFLGMTLDLWGQLEALFAIQTAVVRGLIALWVVELIARLGRAAVDAGDSPVPSLSQLIDRLTSTLVSGISLYMLLAVWVGGSGILGSMFRVDPYSSLGTFLQLGSSFTAALWLLINILTFVAGSRQRAHRFIETIKRASKAAREGKPLDAGEPIEDYYAPPQNKDSNK